MSNFWRRLSKRERGLVLFTLTIVVVFVAKYAALTPLLERREWVKNQLENQPQLLQKNLRYLGQKETLIAALESARGQIKTQEPKLLSGDTPSVTASDLQENPSDHHAGVESRAGRFVFEDRYSIGNWRANSADCQSGSEH